MVINRKIVLYTSTQVHHYDDRKRPDTHVYDVVSYLKRYAYDLKRTVNDSDGFRSITVVSRRVVHDEIRMSFTPETCRKTVVFPTNTTVYATLRPHCKVIYRKTQRMPDTKSYSSYHKLLSFFLHCLLLDLPKFFSYFSDSFYNFTWVF